MMRLKENFIKKVAEELDALNGSEFEALCRPFIEMLTGMEFEWKGHNLEMKAVKGSVDLLGDENFKVIGQCGTEKNYFTSNKPTDDIDSSNRNSPDFKLIYLFCNRKADSKDFNSTQVKIENKLKGLKKGQQYKLYDGQRIAKQIYEHRYLTEKIEEILTKLPGSYQYYLLFPQTNVLPILPSDYEERPEEDEVAKALAQTDFLQIYGLSGIGKSLLSISVANNLSSQFDTILWFNGEDVDVQNLHSVKIQRMEGAVNLSSVLQTFKVLIIVDNLNTGVDELKKSFEKDNKKGSKCIVTSLQLNVAKEHSFALTYVTEEATRKILLNTELPPSDTQLEQLMKQVNGYPLLLELAKKAVSGGDMTWVEVISESNLTEINDPQRNEIFAQRIIGRYVDKLGDMFNLLVCLDSCEVSKIFLREKSRLRLTDLYTYAILQEVSEYKSRIHQVVLASIKAVFNTRVREEDFKTHLTAFLKRHVPLRDEGLYTFMALHRERMQTLVSVLSAEDMLRHLIVMAMVYTIDTYSNQDVYLQLINDLNLDVEHQYTDLCLFIEKKEIEQSKVKKEYGKDDARFAEKVKKDISELESITVNTNEAQSLILHHVGKWLSIIGESQEAEKKLLEALVLNPKSYHSMLKLARDYKAQDKTDKFEPMIHAILNPETFDEVPLSVRLSAYEVISPKKYRHLQLQYIDNQIEDFSKVIYASLSRNYSHTYLVLSRHSKHLSFNQPEFYSKLCAQLPIPLNIEHDAKLRENYGRIKAAQYLYGEYDQEYKEKLFKVAEYYLLSVPRDNDFIRRDIVNLYAAGNRADDALSYFEEIADKEDMFAQQSLSKAYYVKGDYDKALAAAEKSIAAGKDADIEYQVAFLHDKARALHELNDDKAKEVMTEAINKQTNNRVIKEWTAELQSWS